MSAYPFDTRVPEKLSRKYGLRCCEIIEKNRLVNIEEDYIEIRGKRNPNGAEKIRKIHITKEDMPEVVEWYTKNAFYIDASGNRQESRHKTISRSTLYRRMEPHAKRYSGNKNRTVTHRGRNLRYENLPEAATLEDYVALAKELGHGVEVGMQHYNRVRIDKHRKGLLNHLPDE